MAERTCSVESRKGGQQCTRGPALPPESQAVDFFFKKIFLSNKGEFIVLPRLVIAVYLVVILGLALLFFGSKKLPAFGKGLGDGLRQFKSSVKAITEE